MNKMKLTGCIGSLKGLDPGDGEDIPGAPIGQLGLGHTGIRPANMFTLGLANRGGGDGA